MSLDRLFAPRSIASPDASENPARVGPRILTSLERMGSLGEVHPIDRGRATVPGREVRALGAVDALGRRGRAPAPVPLAPPDAPPLPRGRAPVSGTDAQAILAAAGPRVARDAPAADAGALRVPVVLTAVSDAIAHRFDDGLVETGIADARALAAARDRMTAILDRPGEDADRVASGQVAGGVEVPIGVTTDPELGPCLAVGPGGVLVELLSEVAIRPLPLCEGGAAAMIRETRLGRLLDGLRGAPPADAPAPPAAIVTVGRPAQDWSAALTEPDVSPSPSRPTPPSWPTP